MLPDLSERAVADTIVEIEGQLRTVRALPRERLDRAQSIDLTVAEGFLEIQLWEYRAAHFHRGNPSFYTGEAIFGVLSHFLVRSAPLPERVAAATAELVGLGFHVEVVKSAYYIGVGYVYSSSPGAGAMEPKGSTVIIKII